MLYRDIDVSYAVACLAALPHDQMVRELKSSLPSIQSDFSRLQVVAQIGEELSRLWSDENLLLVFQNLQTNSKWWNILSSHGVKVEARSFQNPNLKERETFIRAVIPELLERSHMNLEMVVEYSRQFNLSPEVAVLTYVEHLLSHSSESMSYQEWISCFHKAICGVEEKAVASCIRNSMHKIHPLHYEKIRYACGWIIDYLLAEEDPNSNDCDDDIENNPSVQNKRLSIGSTESGKKVSSASRISLEVASYRKYVDIVDYLVTMKLPSDVISAIPYIGSFYSHSTSSYKDRLPLWQLLEDPWAVFDPLLTFVPEIAAKLSPLCSHLQIDLSDFNARRLMALYNRPVLAEQSVSHSNIEKTKLTSFANILSEMKAITLAPIQQVELLRWIFEKERRDTTQVAVEALNHALFILEAPSTMEAIRDDYIAQESATMMQQELYSELMKLKCEQTIKKFNSYLAENNRIASKLVSLVGEPTVLVKAILEISLELAWDIHIRNFSCDPYVNAMSMSNLPVTHELTKFVETVSLTLNETVAHCSDEENLKATVADSVKVARSKLLGKLLSDVERNSTNNADTRSHGNNWNTPTDFWSSSQETHLMPTASEARRREDLFLGFSAYVTIASCSNSDER